MIALLRRLVRALRLGRALLAFEDAHACGLDVMVHSSWRSDARGTWIALVRRAGVLAPLGRPTKGEDLLDVLRRAAP